MGTKRSRSICSRAHEAVPSDLVFWAEARDWHVKLERLLDDYLTAAVKRRLRGTDPEAFYDDDLSWLEDACDDPFGSCLDDLLADRLGRWRVRTFHAGRPRDVEAYLTGGLRRLRGEEAFEQLAQLIVGHEQLAPLRDEAILRRALVEIEAEGRTGHTFVALDVRELLDGAGHYLIYGSEYLSGILVQAGGCRCQDVLKLEGIPTIFVIDLPVALMRRADVRQFSRFLLSHWAVNVACRRKAAPMVDFTFDLTCDVPAQCITSHHHPALVRDPLHRFEPYQNPFTTCPACAGAIRQNQSR
jgi:hypothetical protein